MGLLVRTMTVEDCDAVAAVRIGGWRWAYAGMMPGAYLDAMSVEENAARLRDRLTGAESTESTESTKGTESTQGTEAGAGTHRTAVNLVAERDGTVVGWACVGPRRNQDVPDTTGELYALYVRPEHISTGVGRALTEAFVERATTDGFSRLVLWVLKENARARRFYEKAGFTPDGAQESLDVGGVRVPEVRYVRTLTPAG
ncbi:GNAT family N-acetyltransferase [Streptomyces sp. PSRA5]|uniref:GNAT family N-acetyltransferase n=1 Tax=Streptomyces panacea TaxID=3035064 RepID=UPI00339CF467